MSRLSQRIRRGRAAAPPTTEATRLAFVHVPKCGGTSVDAALRAALGISTLDGWIDPGISRVEARLAEGDGVPERAVPRWLDHRAYLLFHYLSEQRPMVSGHGPVSAATLDRFAPETPFLTVLRNPIDRWISYFRSNLITSDDPNVEPNRLSRLSPADELDRLLTSESGRYLGAFAAIYLGGHRPYAGNDPGRAVEPAVESLARFAVVGFTSDWSDFVAQCRQRLDLEVDVPHLNATQQFVRPEDADLDALFTSSVRERIATLCDADVVIYREARRLRGLADDLHV